MTEDIDENDDSVRAWLQRKKANADAANAYWDAMGPYVAEGKGEADAELSVRGVGVLRFGLSDLRATERTVPPALGPLLKQAARFVRYLQETPRTTPGQYQAALKIEEGGRLERSGLEEDTFHDDRLLRTLDSVLKRTRVSEPPIRGCPFKLRVEFVPL